MSVEGLTIYHIKSHLQKYRLNIRLPESEQLEMSEAVSGENDGRRSQRGKKRSARKQRKRKQRSSSRFFSFECFVSSDIQACDSFRLSYLRRLFNEGHATQQSLIELGLPVAFLAQLHIA